jgi:hypothetical protein
MPSRTIACLSFALACVAPAARAGSAAPAEVPGLRLAERVEAELVRRPDAFPNDPGHRSLVFPVSQQELLAFMRQIRVFGDPGDLVLGTSYGWESHGAGLLDLLFTVWRPEGRAPRLDDGFWFEANRAKLPLAALYASHRNQIFLPVPGVATGEIHGALPEKPQLPRMRFRVPGAKPVDVDAYHFLALLIAHEPDPGATWKNHLGQPLSADLLLDQARDYYLSSSDTPAEPADHSNLHLVEVLLGASRRRGQDPDAIKRHFLAVELRRDAFEPADETLLLAHYTESLGLLLADPRTRWSPEERGRVRAWLGRLDARFSALEAEESRRLAHLLRGLRLVREHADRLR